MVSQTLLFFPMCLAGCSPSVSLSNAAVFRALSPHKKNLGLHVVLITSRTKSRSGGSCYQERWSTVTWNLQAGMWQISGRAWSYKPESLLFLPLMCLPNFSLSRLLLTRQNEAPNSKFYMFWVNLCPETVSQAQFQITWDRESGPLWVKRLPRSSQPGEGRYKAEWDGHTASPQLKPCVNDGYGAMRKLKHIALICGQNGPCKRQKG